MQNKKGFTLLELLVVVLIIGILAGIALPQYKMAVGKAKFATLKNNVRAIKSALDRYYLVHDSYTLNLNDLDVEITDNECYITSNRLLYCNKNIFGSTMSFRLGYNDRDGRQACFITSNVTNSYANKLCQRETGKTTPQEDKEDYKAYYY